MHFVEPPIRVDPQALVGWADCPAPCHHYDHAYLRGVLGGLRALTGIGGASGEEHQFEFVGAGQVLLQSTRAADAAADVPATVAPGAGRRVRSGPPRVVRTDPRQAYHATALHVDLVTFRRNGIQRIW